MYFLTIQTTNLARQHSIALIVSIITLIFVTALCLPTLLNSEDGALSFAFIGTRFSEGIALEEGGTTGYDGQFAYFIARDGADAVPYIDGPTLRYQRIIYPLTARVLSLGQENLVPWTLLIINILAFSVSVGALSYLLKRMGVSGYYALIYTFWIGNLFAIRFDLNEPLCFMFAIFAIIAYQREQYRWTIFLLVLSTLTKELGLVIAGGLAFHAFFQRKWGWSILLFGAPLSAFLLWWAVMKAWLGALPTIYPSAKLHLIPLEGMFSILTDQPELSSGEAGIQFGFTVVWVGIPALVLVLLALWTIWKKRSLSMTNALILSCCGFVITMPDVSWQDQVAVYRVALPLVLGGVLFIGQLYPKRLKLLAILWVPTAIIVLLIPNLWLGAS